MTAKKRTEQNKQYIFMAYDHDNGDWYCSQSFASKEAAYNDYIDNYSSDSYSNEFFLEVMLPEPEKHTTKIENIPVFTV